MAKLWKIKSKRGIDSIYVNYEKNKIPDMHYELYGSSRDLHIIFNIDSQRFFAIDLRSSELYDVIHRLPADNDDYETLELNKVSLLTLKRIVESYSTDYYKLIEHITLDTIGNLKNIQFGEYYWNWIWFVKQKEDSKIKLGCFKKSNYGRLYAEYMELGEEDYSKHFGKCKRIKEMYIAFENLDSLSLKDSNIKKSFYTLNDFEEQVFMHRLKEKQIESCTSVERYTSSNYIVESEYEGNASETDICIMEFFQVLLNGEIEKMLMSSAYKKHKIYGLISYICGYLFPLAVFTFLPAGIGVIFAILSFEISNKCGISKNQYAVAGLIMSLIALFIYFFLRQIVKN